MATATRHIIQRQTFWLDLAGPQAVPGLQQRVSDYCHQQLPSVLETVFDRWGGADHTVRIEQLTLELGRISSSDLEAELTRQVIRQLEQLFGAPTASAGTPLGETTKASATLFQQLSHYERMAQELRHFLQTGRLSVWFRASDFHELDEWLRSPEAAPFRPELAALLRRDRTTLTRFAAHSSVETLIVLAFLTAEEVTPDIVQLIFATVHELTGLAPATVQARFWSSVLANSLLRQSRISLRESLLLLPGVVASTESPGRFFDRMLSQVQTQPNSESTPGRTRLVQEISDILTDELATDFTLRELSASRPGRTEEPPAVAAESGHGEPSGPTGTETPTARPAIDNSPLVSPRPSEAKASGPLQATVYGEQKSADRTTKGEETASHSSRMTGPLADRDSASLPPRTTPAERSLSGHQSEQQRAGMPVSLAGMVLLHPFIPPLFTELGLFIDRRWADEAAKEKAVQVLAYLGTGEPFCPEYAMPLLKLLCGLSFEAVVAPALLLTEREQHEATELLKTVIGYWEGLGNVSPAGLREAFLQRGGRLFPSEIGWRLVVEPQTLDILLNRLPWGYSMIKLPCMTHLLTVEWT